MRAFIAALAIGFGLVFPAISPQAQGTFQNLDFESASIPNGTQVGSMVPTASGLPGWSAAIISSNGTFQLSQVDYDFLSLSGGGYVCINDTNTGFGFVPLQGKFSAYLIGGPNIPDSTFYTAQISQSGLVPSGTQTLFVDVYTYGTFVVTLGGHTLYGADISAFAGQTEQLSFSAPPTGVPNGVELDKIIFSQNSIPEPGTFGLLALGTVLFSSRFVRRRR
jgi:PEP-CTERM motif